MPDNRSQKVIRSMTHDNLPTSEMFSGTTAVFYVVQIRTTITTEFRYKRNLSGVAIFDFVHCSTKCNLAKVREYMIATRTNRTCI